MYSFIAVDSALRSGGSWGLVSLIQIDRTLVSTENDTLSPAALVSSDLIIWKSGDADRPFWRRPVSF